MPRTVIWADEFDGRAGARPDPTRWNVEVGGYGWGNQERQFYTPEPANARLDGQGNLAITARRASGPADCWYGPCRYTSARLTTERRFAPTYGRVAARIQVPRGRGLWPAFWMLGANIRTAGYPACGEVDIMELVGSEPGTVSSSVHGPGYTMAGLTKPYTLPDGRRFTDGFHEFAVDWSPGELVFSVDGQAYHRIVRGDLPAGTEWVFDRPFYLLLNLAVGGTWPGEPDASTPFPATMLVDWVRVSTAEQQRPH